MWQGQCKLNIKGCPVFALVKRIGWWQSVEASVFTCQKRPGKDETVNFRSWCFRLVRVTRPVMMAGVWEWSLGHPCPREQFHSMETWDKCQTNGSLCLNLHFTPSMNLTNHWLDVKWIVEYGLLRCPGKDNISSHSHNFLLILPSTCYYY